MFQQSFSHGASLSKSVCVRAFFAATFALFICFTASQAIRANTLTVDGRQSAPLSMDSLQNQMELVKADMEKSITNSRLLQNQYSVLANTINDCSLTKIFTHPEVISLFSPAASLCINGAVSTADPDFN